MTSTPPKGKARTASEPVRVFAVDDHPAFLTSIAMVIDATPGFELVGTAGSGPEALEQLLVDLLPVDLLLVDVVMASMSGLELAERYRAADGTAAVVLMSSYEVDDLPDLSSGLPGLEFSHKSDLHPEGLAELWARLVAADGPVS